MTCPYTLQVMKGGQHSALHPEWQKIQQKGMSLVAHCGQGTLKATRDIYALDDQEAWPASQSVASWVETQGDRARAPRGGSPRE